MQAKSEGIWFNYYGDHVKWIWWWNRLGDFKLYSSKLDKDFKSFNDYWKFVGAFEESTRKYRVQSFDESTIVGAWVKTQFLHENIVVLTDINVSAKDASFWLKLPQHYRPHFLGDFVVLMCGDKNEIFRLCDSISRDFAEASGYSGGQLIYWNEEETIKDDVEAWVPEPTPLENIPL